MQISNEYLEEILKTFEIPTSSNFEYDIECVISNEDMVIENKRGDFVLTYQLSIYAKVESELDVNYKELSNIEIEMIDFDLYDSQENKINLSLEQQKYLQNFIEVHVIG